MTTSNGIGGRTPSSRHTLGVAALIAASSSTFASNIQFVACPLTPEDATESRAYGIGGGVQGGGQPVGYAIEGGVRHAGQWRMSFIHLNAPGATESEAFGAVGLSTARQVVGYATVAGAARASLWSGTVGTWSNLHPVGATDSHALGVGGGVQVGWATVTGVAQAGMWTNTAASWVNLHPTSGPTSSQALGTNGPNQVGWAVVSGNAHASLWASTAVSWIDLNPTGATESQALYIDGTMQVGYATISGVRSAGLWTGTSISWVSLSPAGATDSVATAAESGDQVGYATISGATHAGIWGGTAASWVDLHIDMPPGFTSSYATGVYHHPAGFMFISGYGFNSTSGQDEPLLWMGRRIPPYANCDGSTVPPILNANDFQCFLNAYATGST